MGALNQNGGCPWLSGMATHHGHIYPISSLVSETHQYISWKYSFKPKWPISRVFSAMTPADFFLAGFLTFYQILIIYIFFLNIFK